MNFYKRLLKNFKNNKQTYNHGKKLMRQTAYFRHKLMENKIFHKK